LRILGGVVQNLADAVDGAVQVVVEVDEGVGPEALLEFFASDDLAGALQQNGEYLEGLTGELEFDAIFAQFSCFQFNRVEPEPNDRACSGLS